MGLRSDQAQQKKPYTRLFRGKMLVGFGQVGGESPLKSGNWTKQFAEGLR